MRLIFVLLAVTVMAVPVHAERLWLVVGASDPTPIGIVQKTKSLAKGQGLIVQTADCGDQKNVFAWAGKIEPTEGAAKHDLEEIRKLAGDAYLKRCEVRPGTLLAFGLPAIDPSIAEVPESAVNWSDEDRVSTVKALPDGRTIILARYYEPDKEDPLEGRRVRVLLVDNAGKIRQLEKNCIQASAFRTKEGNLAFQCAREQAGNQLFHSVLLFDKRGKKRKEITRCRNPHFAKGYLWCDAESVEGDGTLQLHPTKIGFQPEH
jgi:hypothetical protein